LKSEPCPCSAGFLPPEEYLQYYFPVLDFILETILIIFITLCGLGNFDERDHRIKTAGVQGQ
jgi:hypothetical protein